MIASLNHNRFFAHTPRFISPERSTIDNLCIAQEIEEKLCSLITSYRTELDLPMKWDKNLSTIIGTAVGKVSIYRKFNVPKIHA